MKKSFAIISCVLLLIFFFSSCKKPSADQTAAVGPQPKMQYYANNVLVNCDAISDPNLGWIKYAYIKVNGGNRFDLSGRDNIDAGENGLNFGLGTSVVSGGVYPASAATKSVDCKINNANYHAGNYSVTITAIQNGLATGTFNAVLNPDIITNPVQNITSGTFSNIPVQ